MSLTAAAFLLALAGCLALALFRAPIFGLYAYAAVFYLHPVDRWWGQGLPDLRWHLIIGVVTLLTTLRVPLAPGRPDWHRSPAAFYLIAMSLWLWIQNAWALDTELHFEVSFLFTKYVVLFFLMYRLLDSEEACWNFLRVHVLGCVYLGWLIMAAPDAGRLEGVGGPGIDEANALGTQLATGAFAAGALLVQGPLWSRALGLLALPILGNGIIQTESRGVFVASVVTAFLYLYLLPGRPRKTLAILGLLGILVAAPMVPANFWERMGTISAVTDETQEVDRSTESRLELLRAQWQMFQRYPFGSGHRGTAALSAQYLSDEFLTGRAEDPASRARSSHNTFMTILSEQGIPGVLLILTLILWILRTTRSLRRHILDSEADLTGLHLLLATSISTVTVVMVAGMFTDYFKSEVFVWGLVLLAVLGTLPLARPAPASAAQAPAPTKTTALDRHRLGQTT